MKRFRALIIPLSILYVLAASGCSIFSARHYYRAAILEKEYNYAEAAEELDKIPESDPISPRAREASLTLKAKNEIIKKNMEKGAQALKDGNYELARIHFRKVLALNPKEESIRRQMASLEDDEKLKASVDNLIRKGRLLAAKKRALEELKANPNDAKTKALLTKIDHDISKKRKRVDEYLKRAVELEGKGQFVKAEIDLDDASLAWDEDRRVGEEQERIAELVKKDARAREDVAREAYGAGRVDEAVSMLEENLEALPEDDGSLELLKKILSDEGLKQYLAGNYEAALKYWEKFVEYNPDDDTTREYVGKTRRLIKEIKKIK